MAKNVIQKAKIQLPANVDEQLAEEARNIAKRLGTHGGNAIKCTQQKTFKMPDGSENSGPLQAVIVDFASSNRFFENAFTEDDFEPPICAAGGLEPATLAPFPESPKRQCEACAPCPQNQFGTDARGRGKACQNNYVLALLAPDADENTPLMTIRASPTALGPFDAYVAGLARTFQSTPIKVITTFAFDPKLNYPSLRFGNPQPVSKELLALALIRREEARRLVLAVPNFIKTEVEPAQAQQKGGKKGSRRGA